MKNLLTLIFLIVTRFAYGQMWSDTSVSYLGSIQYKPFDYAYNFTATEFGVYIYNPAHDVHFSLRAGGGTFYPVTAYTNCRTNSVYFKPGIFVVSNKQAEKIQITLGVNLIYAYEQQRFQTIHEDPIWGELKTTYHENANKFGAGIDLSFIYKISYRFQAILSVQSNYYIYNSAVVNRYLYFPGVGTLFYLTTNPAIGFLYKMNK